MDSTKKYIKNQRDKYKSKAAVQEKWIKIYKKLYRTNNTSVWGEALKEAFNLVDIVFGNIIYQLQTYYGGERVAADPYWDYYINVIRSIDFSKVKSFYGKTEILKSFNYPIPDEVDGIRKLRNFFEHNTDTFLNEYKDTQMTNTDIIGAINYLGRALVAVRMLDEENLTVSFEQIRIKEGDTVGYSNEYLVETFITQSGSSRVFLGTHQRLNKKIIIKELIPNTYSDQLISNERDTLVSIRHSQIPVIYDVIYQNMTCYVVMDYIQGYNLDEYIKRKFLTIEEKLRIVTDICRVIDYLHTNYNIIHSDIKPQNVMMDYNDNPNIIDFGVSKKKGVVRDMTAVSKGYTAPEIMRGDNPNVKTDIYSLGMLLRYVVGTGNTDFGKINVEKINEIVEKATNVFPANRYETVSEMVDDLEKLNKKSSSKKWMVVVAGIASLVLVGVIIFAVGRRGYKNDRNDITTQIVSNTEDVSGSDQITQTPTEDVSGSDQISQTPTEKQAEDAMKNIYEQGRRYVAEGNRTEFEKLLRNATPSDIESAYETFEYWNEKDYPDVYIFSICGDGTYFCIGIQQSLTTGTFPNTNSMWSSACYVVSFIDNTWKLDFSAQAVNAVDDKLLPLIPQGYTDAVNNDRNHARFNVNDYSWIDSGAVIPKSINAVIYYVWQNEDGSVGIFLSTKNGTDEIKRINSVSIVLTDETLGEIINTTSVSTTLEPHTSTSYVITIAPEDVKTGLAAWSGSQQYDVSCSY